MTKDDEDLVRKTIRIPKKLDRRITNLLLKKGIYVNESEVFRRALDLGLSVMEKE